MTQATMFEIVSYALRYEPNHALWIDLVRYRVEKLSRSLKTKTQIRLLEALQKTLDCVPQKYVRKESKA